MMLITSVILGFAYSTLLWFKMEKHNEQRSMQMAEFEGMRFSEHPDMDINDLMPPFMKKGPKPPFMKNGPKPPFIEVYFGTDSMPDKYRDLVKGINNGTHEINADTKYYVFARYLPERDETFYLILMPPPDDRFRNVKFIASNALAGIGFVVIILVLLTTRVLSRMVTSPLVNLVSTLKNTRLDKLPDNFSKGFYDDEVGFLAKTIENLLKRLKEYVAREHQFTRDASHELRTPVAVIKSSMDIIEETEKRDKSKLSPHLIRIRRSLIQMESTIEALLWLYRENELYLPKKKCYPVSMAEEIIQNYKAIHQDKGLHVDFIARDNPAILAPPPLLRVIVDNLIRNAFQHTYHGKIKITVNQDGLEVINSGTGDNRINDITLRSNDYRMSAGFGIGLDLVKRLCERFGWKLTVKNLDGAEMMATVNFHVGMNEVMNGDGAHG
jgi:signal transduction histidine kinase